MMMICPTRIMQYLVTYKLGMIGLNITCTCFVFARYFNIKYYMYIVNTAVRKENCHYCLIVACTIISIYVQGVHSYVQALIDLRPYAFWPIAQ